MARRVARAEALVDERSDQRLPSGGAQFIAPNFVNGSQGSDSRSAPDAIWIETVGTSRVLNEQVDLPRLIIRRGVRAELGRRRGWRHPGYG